MKVNIDMLTEKMGERGMNMEDLASKVGVHRATMYRKLAAGGGDITVKQVASIQNALNLTTDECVAIFLN